MDTDDNLKPVSASFTKYAVDHDDDVGEKDDKNYDDDDKGCQRVMPNPHTLNDERSRQGLSMRPARARDEGKK